VRVQVQFVEIFLRVRQDKFEHAYLFWAARCGRPLRLLRRFFV
jgi:hypothetical protein